MIYRDNDMTQYFPIFNWSLKNFVFKLFLFNFPTWRTLFITLAHSSPRSSSNPSVINRNNFAHALSVFADRCESRLRSFNDCRRARDRKGIWRLAGTIVGEKGKSHDVA